MKCKYCENEINDNVKYCPHCGKLLEEVVTAEIISQSQNYQNDNNDYVHCPKCGSTNVHFVSRSQSQGFNATNACCGYLMCGPIGLLCGVNNDQEIETVRKCMNCGHEF